MFFLFTPRHDGWSGKTMCNKHFYNLALYIFIYIFAIHYREGGIELTRIVLDVMGLI